MSCGGRPSLWTASTSARSSSCTKRSEAVAEELRLGPAERARDRRADVAAAAAPSTSTRSVEELTRLRKCSVWRRVAAISAQASSSETSSPPMPSTTCMRDQARDVPVVALGDRARGVERDVRGQRRDARAGAAPGRRPRCARARSARTAETSAGARAARFPVAVRSATSRCSCSSSPRTTALGRRAGSCVSSSSPLTGGRECRRRAATCALAASSAAGTRRVGLLARAHEQHLLDVALGERSLPPGDLDHRGAMPRARRPPGSRATRSARRSARRSRRSRRPCAAPRMRTAGSSPAPHHGYRTTSSAVHAADEVARHVAEQHVAARESAARADRATPAPPPARARRPRCAASPPRPPSSRRSASAGGGRRAHDDQFVLVGPLVVNAEHDLARRQRLRSLTAKSRSLTTITDGPDVAPLPPVRNPSPPQPETQRTEATLSGLVDAPSLRTSRAKHRQHSRQA